MRPEITAPPFGAAYGGNYDNGSENSKAPPRARHDAGRSRRRARRIPPGDYAFAAVPIGKTVSSGGALYNFYMAVSQLPPFSRVGYYEGSAFVEGEAALARAITELVPPFLRPLAELFASYRIY